MAKGDNYTDVVLEEIRDQMQIVVELAVSTNDQVSSLEGTIDHMQGDIAELKSDMKIVKLAVTDTNNDLKLLDRRVTKLEKRQA